MTQREGTGRDKREEKEGGASTRWMGRRRRGTHRYRQTERQTERGWGESE